ncbi:probable ubiquitin carboxyl-terminal hydrolase MINDY-4 isoform X4 [Lemur catta]|uniref:probable ubiquitin carboxyl-terminal hydrolase MINDY-4 isoform X4 n=1 Tax=Lemur catta TaxID=9447 RepID=UPI001E268404|nr:probable ubiquitin carboxyl-terminal hydrolase MINDY-4 isoform X4 [Lemur catta]
MDNLYVEEVAASLVREFLSRKGLKKTCVTMDQERPRSDLSINSRNDLRKVLHLEFLYKENKAKENPLKTNLELITRYFLDHFGNTANNFTPETPIPALSVPKRNNKLPLRCSETTLVNIYDLSDEDAGWRMSLSETSKARRDSLDGDVLGNFVSSKKPSHKSKPMQTAPAGSPTVASAREKTERHHLSEPSLVVKRIGEKTRPKSGLIVRGMMAGPTASSSQDSFRRRSLKRSPALSMQPQEEESQKVPELATCTSACPAPQDIPASSNGSTSKSLLGQLSELIIEKQKTPPSSPSRLPSRQPPQGETARWKGLSEDSPAVDSTTDTDRAPLKFYLPGGSSRMTQERLERAFKRQGSQPPPVRKNQLLASHKADGELGALQLEDVEDDMVREEVILCPVPSILKLQTESKPIDLLVAKEIKTLLFGSNFCCFNEEWKLQSFSFNNTASLKYGIVQKKGGPCGVLAAVQGSVLQKLLFEGDSRANCARGLQPSDAHRTRCLTLAIADIVWRAGGRERAVVTLASGTQQFSPTGKYKADGVLETLTLHSLTCYEELVTFLQQSIHQELVNLLLTGKAVSNVFNDVVELDSGDGNITLLRGIAARSDIGFLSLFEHYNVCQVGCFLKTPRFPIWVVCSESHFSVLFSLQQELLCDWRTERLFDLYYYDGLANQQEQIRLTVDTTQTVPEDRDNDLVPPLELCIRTKWKGALVNWNGSDPIL